MHLPRTNIASYLEERLGPIDCGWSDPNAEARIQVVRFKNQPESNVDMYSTLGLSDKPLEMRKSGRKVRQEFLLCAEMQWRESGLVSVLLGTAERCAQMGSALLRGEIVDLGRPISDEVQVCAVYATNPTVFGEKLLSIDSEQLSVVFVWLVPITAAEVMFVRDHGWSAFEAKLETQDPDLWDLARKSFLATTCCM